MGCYMKRAKMNLSHKFKELVNILKLSATSKSLRLGKTIHAQLLVCNQTSKDSDIIQINSLINLYSKCGQLEYAKKLFDRMPQRNLISWSVLMAGYLHKGDVLEVLGLFRNLVSLDSACPNEYIFTIVLSCCANSGRVQEGKQCHGYLFKSGLLLHQYVKNALVHVYSRCFHVDSALQILETVPGNDVFSYNSILSALVESGCREEVEKVLNMMVDECVSWDGVTHVNMLCLCSHIGDLQLGMQIHAQLMKTGLVFDVFVISALIDMYGKCCKVLNAKKHFDDLQDRNVVAWTAMLTAYLQNGYFEETLNLFPRMELEDTHPNEFTFAVLLNACANLVALTYGDTLHGRIMKLGFKNHLIVGNALVNMYSKSGNVDSSYSVFSNMIYKDVITWNAMICGYSHHGLGKQALLVFQDMMSAGECPNYVTFIGILSACAHLALVQEGFYYFDQLMKELNIEPGLEHYTCMVSLLCRDGQLYEAENFMKTKTQVKWDVVAWRTLLNACHVHRNYSLGKLIAETVILMDPHDVGTYTLLSNMYAKARKWDGVVNIRKLMRERNIKKEPGASWLGIRNDTHVFVSEGSNHPESTQIYEKIQELLAMIKPLGYVPDVGAVLHDVEEEQKEGYLSYHSEKLALAYGLMKIPPPGPIRIIKNLRMCDDCHIAVKLISKVTNRLIVVRDANRFHHFRDGLCTCNDHW
ncbi:pentatricopeptide repeat-containing protein At5g39680 [Vigna unguiculata]|uniref:pentatricopeptide repeat-containing protein At5g39680 n=1 Tax=Vigna unguiculata TaxID=3917 RepID=UPI00101622D9|nr:pentatricopeptide repeat-containing protein At5g39680 [Vigna unguiculata]XP_027924691.1 pentatricopeptide repeat-containing protein At5g39680 [Vigna unguiculata]